MKRSCVEHATACRVAEAFCLAREHFHVEGQSLFLGEIDLALHSSWSMMACGPLPSVRQRVTLMGAIHSLVVRQWFRSIRASQLVAVARLLDRVDAGQAAQWSRGEPMSSRRTDVGMAPGSQPVVVAVVSACIHVNQGVPIGMGSAGPISSWRTTSVNRRPGCRRRSRAFNLSPALNHGSLLTEGFSV